MFFGKLFGKKSEEDELFYSLEPSFSASSSSSSLPRTLIAPLAYNIILIGSAKAHKRELLKILCDCEPALVKPSHYRREEMGVSFKRKEYGISRNNKIKLNIWTLMGMRTLRR